MKNDMTTKMTNVSLADSLKQVPYDKLDEKAKARVDNITAELKALSSSELIVYGLETQTNVSKQANYMLTEIGTPKSIEDINKLFEEVNDISKPFMTSEKRKNFLSRFFNAFGSDAKQPFNGDVFVGKINELVYAIENQNVRLMYENAMYDEFFELLVENVHSLAEYVMACERAIAELKSKKSGFALELEGNSGYEVSLVDTELNTRIDQLTRKLNMFMISKQESMQTAVSVKLIQQNNIKLSDRLQTVLVAGIPILQNQILLKASMADTQRGLDICDKVSDTINKSMNDNAATLRQINARLAVSGSETRDIKSAADVARDILDIAKELKEANSKAKAEFEEAANHIKRSEQTLSDIFEAISKQRPEP